MSLSLREQRKVRTSQSITAAALELFSIRGYAAVTMSEIAAAAGVGERTVYRYFPDKEELFFAEDHDFRAALRAAIEDQSPDQAPFTVLRAASAPIAHALQDRRDELRRRAQVIAGVPALAAREQAKYSAWALVLAEGLEQRGVGSDDASLLGRVAVACYNEALGRWLTLHEPHPTLVFELKAIFDQLGQLTT